MIENTILSEILKTFYIKSTSLFNLINVKQMITALLLVVMVVIEKSQKSSTSEIKTQISETLHLLLKLNFKTMRKPVK